MTRPVTAPRNILGPVNVMFQTVGTENAEVGAGSAPRNILGLVSVMFQTVGTENLETGAA
jgi:hypothetical protein